MGGSGGGIIVRNAAINTLGDPQVHGALPLHLQNVVDQVLARPQDQWGHLEKIIIAHVYSWALCNLP
jgi:hypothetical protein